MNALQTQLDLRGSIEPKTGTPWNLVGATDPVTSWEEDNGIELPSHFRDYKKASMEDSQFGTLSWQGCLLVDLCHAYDVESWNEVRFDIFESNARSDRLKGKTNAVEEYINARTEVVYENMLDNFAFKNVLLGGAELPETVYEDRENELWELAKRMAYSKFAFGTFRAYLVEKQVIEVLEDMDVGEIVVQSDKIAEYVDLTKDDGGSYDSAESAGIDIYLPEEDTAIQVKEGDGGNTDDKSDVLARFIHEDVAEPYVHLRKND